MLPERSSACKISKSKKGNSGGSSVRHGSLFTPSMPRSLSTRIKPRPTSGDPAPPRHPRPESPTPQLVLFQKPSATPSNRSLGKNRHCTPIRPPPVLETTDAQHLVPPLADDASQSGPSVLPCSRGDPRAESESVMLQEGMPRCMKEQRSINLRPHEMIAKRDSMLFVALTLTLAVFTVIGFSKPTRLGVRMSKDDRGNRARPHRLGAARGKGYLDAHYRAFGRGDRLVDPGSPARYSAELPCLSSCAHFKSAPSPRPRPLVRCENGTKISVMRCDDCGSQTTLRQPLVYGSGDFLKYTPARGELAASKAG